jgi:Leucine-rich repeat (LRR) protein
MTNLSRDLLYELSKAYSFNLFGEKLALYGSDYQDEATKQMLDENPDFISTVYHLELYSTTNSIPMSEKEELNYEDLLSRFTNLQHLFLHGNHVNQYVANALPQLKKLKSVYLGDCRIDHLEPFKRVSQLDSVTVSNIDVDDCCYGVFQECGHLRSVTLSGWQITDTTARCIQYASQLTKVTFVRANISNESAPFLVKFIDLNELRINYCPNTTSEVLDMLNLLQVQSLGLRGMKLDARAFDKLRELPSLKELDISECTFEKSEFIRYIAQAPLLKLIALSTGITAAEIRENSKNTNAIV